MSSATENPLTPSGPVDPEILPVLEALDMLPSPFTRAHLDRVRVERAQEPDFGVLTRGRLVEVEELVLGEGVDVSLLLPSDATGPLPSLVFAHGGGLMFGNRFLEGEALVDLVESHGIAVAAVEYRLAPEHPYPAALDDVMAVIAWISSGGRGGLDPAAVIVGGRSAGGHLAAAAALRARDEGIPLLGQLLIYPMLDDRTVLPAGAEPPSVPVWNHTSNRTSWDAYLGGVDDAPYGVPARAAALGGMTPAYLEVGTADLFRDECTRYALGIWAAGGEAELHVWDGAFHGSDHVAPTSRVSAATLEARSSWIARRLASRR